MQQNSKEEQKNAAQIREKVFMGCFALATVFGAAGAAVVPLHEPTAMVLMGLCALSLAGGCVSGVVEMGIESVKCLKTAEISKGCKNGRVRE